MLLQRGLCTSREQARGLILAGKVKVAGKTVDKAGQAIAEDAAIEIVAPEHNYVSRGGLKLEKAVQQFGFNLLGRRMLDVGSSTGGFTDCALQNGVARVIALDVGTGQLDWKLRNDSRVHVMEKTNIRFVSSSDLPFTPDLVTIDVSFISLRLVLPVVYGLLGGDGEVIALIKPQFEAGKEQVSRGKGVIRDAAVHHETIMSVLTCAQETGFSLSGLTWSPIRGPEGNIEFIAWLRKGAPMPVPPDFCDLVCAVVEGAHKDFSGEK